MAVNDLSFEINEGHVRIDGYDIFEEPDKAKKLIGYLPEQPPLYMNETPREYLKFVGEAKGLRGRELKEQMEQVIRQTKLEDVQDRLISKLSKGYKQRVGIAQALLGNPRVIILDEPTVGLDPIQIIEIRDLIRQLGQSHTVILSSHILSEVQAICKKILIINKGKLVAFDEPENLEKLMMGSNEIVFVTDAEAGEIEEILTALPEVTEWNLEESGEKTITVRIKAGQDNSYDVCRKLFFAFAGIQKAIIEMTAKKASLEEVFIELTESEGGRVMTVVLKHELSGCFRSLTAYVFGAFLLVFVGIGAMLFNIQSAVSNFEYVLSFVSLVLAVIVPILTMRVIAEERKQKTDQLLYSLPITTAEVVIGKFCALLLVYFIPLLLIGIYPYIFSQYGDVYLLTSYGSLLAFFIMGAALTAIGMFISSLTENQGFAAGISVAVILLNYYSVSLAEYVSSTAAGSMIALCVTALILGAVIYHLTRCENFAYAVGLLLMFAVCAAYYLDSTKFEGLLPDIMTKLSLFERFNTFVYGVFDLSAITYYVTVIVFFLFLTVQSLEKRRYN